MVLDGSCGTGPDKGYRMSTRASRKIDPEYARTTLTFSVRDYATLAGIGLNTAYRAVEDGEVESIRHGRVRRIVAAPVRTQAGNRVRATGRAPSPGGRTSTQGPVPTPSTPPQTQSRQRDMERLRMYRQQNCVPATARRAGGTCPKGHRQGAPRPQPQCPAHDDGHGHRLGWPSGGQQALVFCYAGCPTESVLHALRLNSPDLYDYPAGVEWYRLPGPGGPAHPGPAQGLSPGERAHQERASLFHDPVPGGGHRSRPAYRPVSKARRTPWQPCR